jgi:hypothetical protein
MTVNRICDLGCLNQACEFDNGDCECSKGCFMYFQDNEFISVKSNDSPQSCYVPDCWFNIQDSNDNFVRRSRILSTLITKDYSYFDINKLQDGCTEITIFQTA